MKQLTVASLLAVLISSNPLFAQAVWYPLSDDEVAQIEAGLSTKLLDPESVRVTDLMAAEGELEIVTVCGNVQGRNTFGGYAQPVPFMGHIVPTEAGEKVFIAMSVAEPTANSQQAVLKTCLSQMPDS